MIPENSLPPYPLSLIAAAEAEKAAIAQDAMIARHFGQSTAFVTRQRECNRAWHEQMEVRWRTETFSPLAARREQADQERCSATATSASAQSQISAAGQSQMMAKYDLTSRQLLDGTERILLEMFPPSSSPNCSYEPPTWLERQVELWWQRLCHPAVWIVVSAGILLYLGMCWIDAHVPGAPQ